jgi:hypothetical protein
MVSYVYIYTYHWYAQHTNTHAHAHTPPHTQAHSATHCAHLLTHIHMHTLLLLRRWMFHLQYPAQKVCATVFRHVRVYSSVVGGREGAFPSTNNPMMLIIVGFFVLSSFCIVRTHPGNEVERHHLSTEKLSRNKKGTWEINKQTNKQTNKQAGLCQLLDHQCCSSAP